MSVKTEHTTKTERYKIYIVDDHPSTRRGLTEYINATKNFITCGKSDNINSCLNELDTLRPHIVLIDLSLKNESGFTLIEEMNNHYKNIKTVVYSMHENMYYIERSFRIGAQGYVTKNEPEENLLKAFESVLDGNLYVKDDIKTKLLETLLNHKATDDIDVINTLTRREFDVFKKIGDGQSIQEIASKFLLSVNTIQTYRERIKEKLGIEKSKDLAFYAFQWKSQNKKPCN